MKKSLLFLMFSIFLSQSGIVHAIMGPKRFFACIFMPGRSNCTPEEKKYARGWLAVTSATIILAIAAAIGIKLTRDEVEQKKKELRESSPDVNSMKEAIAVLKPAIDPLLLKIKNNQPLKPDARYFFNKLQLIISKLKKIDPNNEIMDSELEWARQAFKELFSYFPASTTQRGTQREDIDFDSAITKAKKIDNDRFNHLIKSQKVKDYSLEQLKVVAGVINKRGITEINILGAALDELKSNLKPMKIETSFVLAKSIDSLGSENRDKLARYLYPGKPESLQKLLLQDLEEKLKAK